jgi:protein-disulfide isomerase
MPIYFWDVDVVEPVEQIETGFKLNSIEISPDGKLLAAGNDNGDVAILIYLNVSW